MSELQVLLLEADSFEGGSLAARLRAADHHVTLASGSDGALQAVLIQQFDVCVIGPGLGLTEAQDFVSALGELDAARTPVLVCRPPAGTRVSLVGIDGFLDPGFDDGHFLSAVALARQRENLQTTIKQDAASALAVLDADAFEEQCVGDRELMAELIDLFAEERNAEIPEMHEALGGRDWQRLHRLAHTLKGSLATLHAPRARQHAFELEMAAKAADGALSASIMAALEADLEELTAELNAFRKSRLQP